MLDQFVGLAFPEEGNQAGFKSLVSRFPMFLITTRQMDVAVPNDEGVVIVEHERAHDAAERLVIGPVQAA